MIESCIISNATVTATWREKKLTETKLMIASLHNAIPHAEHDEMISQCLNNCVLWKLNERNRPDKI